MGTVLARAGLRVLVLEKTLEHKDVVRGEWLAPWGVEEANRLALTDVYMAAGAHRVARHIAYSDLETVASAEARTLHIDQAVSERPVCLGHPRTCNLLNDTAVEAGATLLRGVQKINVTPGEPPIVTYRHQGQDVTLTPRLVIGADGRNGVVAKQIGCVLHQDKEHHLFSGMLVEDAHDWPEDLQVVATENDVNVLAFPQGEGRVRIYLGWPSADRTRLLGPQGPHRFLESWQLDCVPDAEAIVNATPASPCIAYPNFDAWQDSPVRQGVVLVGDAAGRNDPIIGQGLSITHRDVRLVSEIVLSHPDGPWDFTPYVQERQERMSRLRTSARLTSLRDSAFGDAGKRLRERMHATLQAEPELETPFLAPFVGPEKVPAECFSAAFTEQIVGEDLWSETLA